MAGHLLRGGYHLTVWNRTPAKAEPLIDAGARGASSLRELGETCETVCICVNRTEDVAECLNELKRTGQPGSLFIDHSTILPEAAKQFQAELKTRGIAFVDAPVTGGSMGAQKGQLTIFCGGDEDDVERALTAIDPYAKKAKRVGGPGAGQLMKLANQIAVAGSLAGLCESLAFAEKAGLSLTQAKELIGSGAAGSWAFENYGPKILEKDWSPGFSVKNQRKDLAYCIQTGQSLSAQVPVTSLIDKLLEKLEDEGHGEWATAALYQTLLEGEPHG